MITFKENSKFLGIPVNALISSTAVENPDSLFKKWISKYFVVRCCRSLPWSDALHWPSQVPSPALRSWRPFLDAQWHCATTPCRSCCDRGVCCPDSPHHRRLAPHSDAGVDPTQIRRPLLEPKIHPSLWREPCSSRYSRRLRRPMCRCHFRCPNRRIHPTPRCLSPCPVPPSRGGGVHPAYAHPRLLSGSCGRSWASWHARLRDIAQVPQLSS